LSLLIQTSHHILESFSNIATRYLVLLRSKMKLKKQGRGKLLVSQICGRWVENPVSIVVAHQCAVVGALSALPSKRIHLRSVTPEKRLHLRSLLFSLHARARIPTHRAHPNTHTHTARSTRHMYFRIFFFHVYRARVRVTST
jgi:hypothetical protein